MGGALLIGRVGSGYALDHFFAPRVALVFFGGAAVGMGLLWSGALGGTALLAAALVGMGMGAEVDIIAYMTSRYFGLRETVFLHDDSILSDVGKDDPLRALTPCAPFERPASAP